MSLRILMVSEDIPHPKLGGLGKHVILLANALIEAGHQVDLFGNNHWPYEPLAGDVQFQGRFFPALNVKHAHWKEKQLGFFNYYRRTFLARRFARAIRAVADKYDVVHYHGHLPIVANYLPKTVNFVQTRHDQGSDCLTHVRFRAGDICRETDPRACAGCATAHPNPLQRTLSSMSVTRWRNEVRRAFERHKVIFVSQFLCDNLARTLGPLDGNGVHVVHNFVDTHVLTAALAAPGTENHVPDIFIAARIDATKGVGAFLAAAQGRLPSEWQITVAGDGPELAALRQRFAGDQVEFLGWTPYEHVVRLTTNAKVVVVPSVWEEAFGQTTLEALILGRPVLALRRGGTPELTRYERYPGQLTLCEDMDELVAALAKLPTSDQGVPAPNDNARDVHSTVPLIDAIYQE